MEKELEKVKGALEDFRKKFVDVMKKGKGEADRVAKVAQVKIEIGSLKRQKKDLFGELGESFYKNYRKPAKKDEETIADIVAHVSEIDKRLAGLNRDLKSAEKEEKPAAKKRGRPAAKPATGTGAAAKKRGRPAKAAAASTAPKKRGRPPKSATAAKKADTAAPKRRGRPPKAAS